MIKNKLDPELGFEEIFEIEQQAIITGDFSECNMLIRDMKESLIYRDLPQYHIENLLAGLRLTRKFNDKIEDWWGYLYELRGELKRLGEDHERILCDLMPKWEYPWLNRKDKEEQINEKC